MEANGQLLRVIQEMRAEIKKLEKENQALRMKLISSSQRSPESGGQSADEWEEDVTDLGNVMIVRRYSLSSPIHSFAANDPWKAGKRQPNSDILEAQRTVKSLACSSFKKQDNEEKIFADDSFTGNNSSQRASPEHTFGCRDKIKTVGFLLPMDISSYSKNFSSLKYSPNQTTSQLSTIAE
ncbi:putative coiled-coil domain-containing protein 195 isoform X2 [Rhinolophus sinicus]|uniref:putative coiled-coil domain-containing protein 195 isoform X2 n=1 Tax=Rhinolophus sinicus TaxID=89399 RepID=UPI003D7B5BE7